MRPDVRHDLLTARLADLDSARAVLAGAAGRLDDGWVQHEWKAAQGHCLVGAVRSAGPPRAAARALDLLWHALNRDAAGVRWLAPPEVRLARLRDLTRWNDRQERTVADVVGLVLAADRLAAGEMARLRAELGTGTRVRA